MKNENLKKALLKKALGGKFDEVVEEFEVDEDGNPVMKKRKVTTKFNMPDVSALKILLEDEENLNVEHMTDVELENEKERLLQLLKEVQDEN